MNESGKGSPESSNGSRVRHSVLRQLATLETMPMDQLRERWRDLYGAEPPHYRRQFLIKRLAYRIQELFYGGLSDAAKTRLQQAAQDDPMARHGPPGLRQSPEPGRHPARHPVRPDMEGSPL